MKVTAKKETLIDVVRTQIPMAPEFPVTFQGIQGTTVRGPEGEPKGLVLDLFRPHTMQGEDREPEYFQHLYMGLGRAQKLEWMLLRNFPRDETGELDWGIFEKGPPDFLVEFSDVLARKAKMAWPKLLKAQRELGMPAWEDVPLCSPDPCNDKRFLYDPVAWGNQARKTLEETPNKRRLSKSAPATPVTLQKDRDTQMPPPQRRRLSNKTATPERPKAGIGDFLSLSVGFPGLCPAAPCGWWCSLLGRHVGTPLPPPTPVWFNNPVYGAVVAGRQQGLTCGMFAVNHCLASRGMPVVALPQFRFRAGGGCHPEGDFESTGLQRNIEAQGCFFFRTDDGKGL